MALEASNQEAPVNDPDNPDVDNMTYEQLMEMGENAGKVNKGYSKEIIDSLKPILWREGKTKENSCSITFDDFTIGQKVKELPCGHCFDAVSIDKWLENEKRCPVCNKPPF